MRILACGDIHTKNWIIDEVEEIIDNYDAVVFVGDYSDNWNTPPMHSLSTWRMLKMLMDNEKVHAVIGNHDYAYIHPEIAGRSSGWNQTTFVVLNTPEKKDIKDWLLSLPAILELDGVTFSHAGVTEEWNGDQSVHGLWNDTSPIWARPRQFGGQSSYKQMPQVIGHNPSKKIWQPEPNIWCIDTFSEHQDNTPIGDETVLEIVDGKEFNIIKLKEKKDDDRETTRNNKPEAGSVS
jgi:hypothetical protein